MKIIKDKVAKLSFVVLLITVAVVKTNAGVHKTVDEEVILPEVVVVAKKNVENKNFEIACENAKKGQNIKKLAKKYGIEDWILLDCKTPSKQ